MECEVWSGEWRVWSVKCGTTIPSVTATLASPRSCPHIPPETRRMSQSATFAAKNDMTTSSDMSRKSRSCDYSQCHGNFSPTTVVLTHSS